MKMIKIDELREFRPTYQYENGENINLEAVKAALTETAEENGIAIAFYEDQVKSGGIFNRVIEDCLVMYHPEHRYDYFTFCIRVQREGPLTLIAVNDFGSSKQMDKFARAENARLDRQGKDLSYQIGSLIGSGLRNIGKSKQKLEEEQNYYAAVEYLLDQVIS